MFHSSSIVNLHLQHEPRPFHPSRLTGTVKHVQISKREGAEAPIRRQPPLGCVGVVTDDKVNSPTEPFVGGVDLFHRRHQDIF